MNLSPSVVSFLRRMRSGASVDPVRDWLVLVAFSSVILVGIIIWNVWAFDTVANGGVIGSAAPKAEPLFDPAALDAVRKVFADRAAEEAKYVTGVYRFADPSQ